MPLAAKPATAPARPGLDGAPSRRAASRQASGPIESRGISVRHKRALSPTRLSITQIAATASETVTTNLNRKRLLFTASEISGRKPIAAKNKIAAMMIPPATAHAKIDRKRHGTKSFTSSSMRLSVFTSATPVENGQRFQCAMQRDADGTLCHLESIGCLADAAAIQRYGSDDFPLLRLQVL